MTRTIVVFVFLASAFASGCGSTSQLPTVPPSAQSAAPLPQVEPVRGSDHKRQALEGAIARFVQWNDRHYGATVLDTSAENSCTTQVEDLWRCSVTVRIIHPLHGFKPARQSAVYTVTRDPEKRQMIYLPGGS